DPRVRGDPLQGCVRNRQVVDFVAIVIAVEPAIRGEVLDVVAVHQDGILRNAGFCKAINQFLSYTVKQFARGPLGLSVTWQGILQLRIDEQPAPGVAVRVARPIDSPMVLTLLAPEVAVFMVLPKPTRQRADDFVA